MPADAVSAVDEAVVAAAERDEMGNDAGAVVRYEFLRRDCCWALSGTISSKGDKSPDWLSADIVYN